MSWFSDLIDAGVNEVTRKAQSDLKNTGTSAHIQAQNQVVSDFQTQALTPLANGTITPQQAIDIIDRLDRGFTAYCQQLGYARALAGAQTVHALAVKLIADREATITTSGGTYYTPGSGGSTSVPTSTSITSTGVSVAGLGTLSWTSLGLAAAAFYLLHKNRVF
jgi:hypothetical protein